MVSIHRVPVNVLLIISVVYLIFRFKCGVVRLSNSGIWRGLDENKQYSTPVQYVE